ncbi:MAG TPA: Hsp20/alpha crystallin family protein [Nitrososphaerales archaeon]|nr:Hsp20/alpha crystallin family protein [Nitrososphaerales archaeon]
MSTRTIRRKNSNITGSTTQLAINPQQTSLATGFDQMFDQLRRSFDDLMSPFYPFTGIATATPLSQLPIRYSIVDLVDEGDQYTIYAELPGFSKDQVDVKVNKDGLVIRAEQKAETEEKNKNYLHRERAYSAFERVVEFPEEVNPQKVDGTMKDGILQLTIPKKEPKPEERLTRVQLK